MKAEVVKEHEWLKQLIGEWTFETEANMGPDKPCEKFAGTESVRSLGDVWILGEGGGDTPGGGKASNLITLGYDTQKKRFVGTWIGSMMNYMWVYEGSLDSTGKILTLSTKGPSFAGNDKMADYEDIIEIKSPDHRTLTSRTKGDDGNWNQFMIAHYHKKS